MSEIGLFSRKIHKYYQIAQTERGIPSVESSFGERLKWRPDSSNLETVVPEYHCAVVIGSYYGQIRAR